MSATLILKAKEPIIGFTGEALTEPDPVKQKARQAALAAAKTDAERAAAAELSAERPISTGRFLANFVQLGKGQPEDKHIQCQALALDLYNDDEVPLSADDVVLILSVLRQGVKDQAIYAWVVGHFQYLLDPKSVPEAMRERMAKHYDSRPPVVTAAPPKANGAKEAAEAKAN